MRNVSIQKIFRVTSLLFIFIFFFVIEWRWEIMLLGMPDIKAHIMTAIVSAVVIALGFCNLNRQQIIARIMILLILYFIGVSVLNITELYGTYNYSVITELGIWCINLAPFIVLSNYDIWKFVYLHPKAMVTLYMFFTIPLFFLLWYSGCAIESNFNLRNAIVISGLARNSDYGISYQSLGDKLALLTFIILSLKLRKKFKIVIFIVALSTLYITGSKASMIGYIFTCVVYCVILFIVNKQYLKSVLIIFVSIYLLFGGLIYIAGSSSLQNSDNWLVSTLARGKNDVSVSSRYLIEKENEKTRNSRILFGDYKFDNKLGRHGSYTHSALGIVDYYGLPIFIITVSIWFYLLFKLLFVARKTPIARAALMSMLFYTLLFTIARFPPVFYLTYWVLGMAVCAIHHKICALISNKL